MNYVIKDEVPEVWDFIIDAFIEQVQLDQEFNDMAPVWDLVAEVRHGLLTLTYKGGDRSTDSYARFCTSMSSKVCSGCGSNATRTIFESPKCDDCF